MKIITSSSVMRAIRSRFRSLPALFGLLTAAVIVILTLIVSNQPGYIGVRMGDRWWFKIELPGGGVEEVIDKLMSDESRRQMAIMILAQHHDLYHIYSQALIDRIGNEANSGPFAEKMFELVNQKRGPFSESGFYDLHEPDSIVDFIRKSTYDSPAVAKLRQAILRGELDDKVWAKEQEVTVRRISGIARGSARVCEQSEFHRLKIRLFHAMSGPPVRVTANIPLENGKCAHEPNDFVDISVDDFDALGQTTRVFARAEPKTYQEMPGATPRNSTWLPPPPED